LPPELQAAIINASNNARSPTNHRCFIKTILHNEFAIVPHMIEQELAFALSSFFTTIVAFFTSFRGAAGSGMSNLPYFYRLYAFFCIKQKNACAKHA
jgi:hypothetical protein